MKSGGLGRYALTICAAAALLAGCGGKGGPVIPGQNVVVDNFSSGHHTFQYTGAKQAFEVPNGVYQIKVWAHGGSGDGDPRRFRHYPPSRGGYGGRVTAIIPVTPHERLVVYVGGNGSEATGGFNGGGDGSMDDSQDGFGGGGASDIRQHGDRLGDRILVAGGGGGAGGDGFGYGYGGYAGGGKGGGLVGGAGSPGGTLQRDGAGGGGGTQSAGGSGGAEGSDCYYNDYGKPGNPGVLGIGGSGGNGGLTRYSAGGGGGGGGGGGYYGGGAGGAGCSAPSSYFLSGGGGGGGSSYVEPSAIKVRMWSGWKRNKHGLVVFDW